MASQKSVRFSFSICAKFFSQGYYSQIDIKTAFLYAQLEKDYFYELPLGRPLRTGNELVWQSNAALCGHPCSTREFSATVTPILLGAGFVRCDIEPCLFLLWGLHVFQRQW